MLTDDDQDRIARRESMAGRLIWAGFSQDENGSYTQPVLSKSVRDLCRAIEAEATAPLLQRIAELEAKLSAAPAAQPISACAQCKKAYRKDPSTDGCPRCAPGTQISEVEFQKPIGAPTAQPMTEQEILDAFESSPDVDDDDAAIFIFQAGVRYAEKRLGIKEQP